MSEWIGYVRPLVNPCGVAFCILCPPDGNSSRSSVLLSLPKESFDRLRDHHGMLGFSPSGSVEVWGVKTNPSLLRKWFKESGVWEEVAGAPISNFDGGPYRAWRNLMAGKAA